MSSSLKDELYGKTARTAALQWEFGFAHFSIKFREERKKYLDYMYFYDFKLWWLNCQPSSRKEKEEFKKVDSTPPLNSRFFKNQRLIGNKNDKAMIWAFQNYFWPFFANYRINQIFCPLKTLILTCRIFRLGTRVFCFWK